MPTICAIFGCNNRNSTKGLAFFSIPTVRKREGPATEELSQRRRMEWVKAINRRDISMETVAKHHLVCAQHFISGKPAYLHDETNPDWVPSVNLGYGEPTTKAGGKYERLRARQCKRKAYEAATTLLELQNEQGATAQITTMPGREHVEFDEIEATNHKSTQTELTAELLERQEAVINDMTLEIASLKERVQSKSFDIHMFEGNDENVRYYTGLPCWLVLCNLVQFLTQYIPRGSRNSLSTFQEVLIVLMKLRLGSSYKIIGDLMGVHKSTVSNIFTRILNIMYHKMIFLLHWPTRECLEKTMPLEFVQSFGKRVAVIIDCFEIFIETPSNVKARAQTYSHYKSHNTIKYLMGITPQGSICYLSEGWGGRTSDKHIVENSNFLNKLNMGDIVLADRGFDIHESVNLMCAELKIPAFTHGKKQLSAFEIESTRKIAHLRIHVERLIGNMKCKYTILGTTIPIDYLLTSQDSNNSVTTLDQIVSVCACLTNLSPSVVPFT